MSPICCALCFIAGFLALVYVFLTWNFDYWRKRGIQTATSWPFVGSFPSIFTRKRNIAYDIDDIYQEYKETDKIVGVFTTRRPQLLVTCPEYIHKIYATDFRSFHDNERGNFVDKRVDKILGNNPFVLKGDEWKERRTEITPGLSPNRVKAVYPVSQSVCKKFVDYLRHQGRMATSTSQGLDAMELSLCYTTEVVSDCVLGISAQSFTDTPTPLVGMIKRVFNSSFGFIFYSMVANIWPPIQKFYSVALFTKEAEDFFFDIMRRSINLRREKSGQQRDDFLNYMLQLQEKKGLDTAELTSHTMTFLTDGFETTALVLSHTLLLLGRHPEEQQKVRQEIGHGELSFEQLTELPYLEACIHETLRLFSPQVASRKLVTEPYEFVNKDGVTLKLKPGDVVIIPVKALHHDPQYYESPESFRPERFLEVNGGVKKYRDQGVFLPFGDGPRICPGIRFALTQLKAALVEIVRNFDIRVNPKTRSDDRLDDTFFMATLKGGIFLDFKERSSAFASGCAMCPISTALFVVAALLALIYIFLVWNFNYWKKRGIPSAKTWPFVGSFPSVFTQKRNVVYDIDEIYEQYKNTDSVVGVFQTRLPQLLITSPEYAHKIFVSDFRSFHDNEMARFTDKKVDKIFANNPFVLTGEAWKERRAEVTPGLSANRVKAAYPVSQSVCKKFVDYIKRQLLMASSDGLNAKDLCLCYTTEVVSDCVLGISAQSFTDNPTPLVGMIKRVFEQSFGFIFYMVVANLWPPIRKIYSVGLFAKDVEEFFYDIMRKCIEMRRDNPVQQRDDFLNYMLQLQDKKGLDTLELTSHTMTFLTDGFETTSQVLSHALLLLGRNPEMQNKLRKEIGTEELTFEQLSELPYLEACIHETLRLFSPMLAARKLVTETYEFVNKNGVSVKVHPGDVVIIPANALHYDPQYYEDPQSFKPERFLEINGGAKKYRDQGVYYGFGDGPRICPGMRFALTQLKAAMVEIIRNFDVKVNPKTRKDNRFDDTFFMAALKGGIWLDFVERK
ncbi:uncharacterized protein LOC108148033 [Drosophila elegans]|uniref:uncharacterized protein LOC108148033 n=1 Tax=Drosophila elegans TaxID=30023 RepID=UPI001BC84006|nr:uncharacterized protein LOC108148033 [Drosophila elegans]